MSSISFDNVYLLLIAVPLIVLFTVPFAIAVRKSNRNGHNIASQVMHIVMAIIIGFAAAGTSLTTVLTETEVYVVADVSYSANYNLDTVDEYIRNLKLPRNSKVGLVCFGKNYELVSRPGSLKNIASVKTANVDNTETNISEALTYTGTLFGTDVIKRIVLITDGKQTDLRSESSIRRAVDGLETQNIKVDAIFLDDNPNEDNKEVQISGVEFTGTVYKGSEQTVRVVVQTSFETDATITLKRGGEAVRTLKDVDLTTGLNNIVFDLDTSIAGAFDYEVSLVAAGDTSDKNNVYFFTQTVTDQMNVLIITSVWEDCKTLVERYRGKGSIEVYETDRSVANATKNSFVAQFADDDTVNIHINNNQVPAEIEDLSKFDEIVLSNIDLLDLFNYATFIESLNTTISVYGKSLVTLGNMNVQNRTDEAVQQLGSMLPVNFGNNDEARLFTFVIDTSRSMYTLWHLDHAKEIATGLVDVLNDTDYVCVIRFDGDAYVVLPATSLREREKVKDTINHFEVRNGTMIGSGLYQAYREIQDLQYNEKQLILFSDGLTFGDDPYVPQDVVRDMYNEGIYTAVFDPGRLGGDTGSDAADNAAAKQMLQEIAKIGSGNEFTDDPGNYFFINNVEYLDGSMFQNIVDELIDPIIEEDASVNVKIIRDSVLDGIDRDVLTNIPDVSGYIYSESKPSASNVLTVNHKRKNGAIIEKPLYAHWEYGNGRVSTFTSSLGVWTQYWDESLSDAFFGNVFTTAVPDEKHDMPYAVNVISEGKYTTLQLEVAKARLGATATLELTLPNGETESYESTLSGFLYSFELETANVGKYAMKVSYLYDGKEYVTETAVYVCYLGEYDAFTVFEPSELHRAIDGRGTVSHDGKLQITNNSDEVGKYVYDLTVPLLIAAAVLFIVDIVVRKLKWEDIVSFFGRGGNKKEGKK